MKSGVTIEDQLLNNSDYDELQRIQIISNRSDLFKSILIGLLQDTDNDFKSNQAWLGTLNLSGNTTQVKLVVTQEPNAFIDEN